MSWNGAVISHLSVKEGTGDPVLKGWVDQGETRKKRKQKRITTTPNSLYMRTLVAALDDG